MPRYYYDLHTHTKEISPCGYLPVLDLLERYRGCGYEGIVLTDHFRRDFWRGKGDWPAAAERFLAPWRTGCAYGEKFGFWVGLGMEIQFDDNPNDILLYGFSPELFLAEGRDWLAMGLPAFYRRYQSEILIIQAHPNRWDSSSPDDPRFLHGVEAYNANPRHDNHNEVTMRYGEEHPALILTAGSDSHQPEDVGQAGIAAERILRSGEELVPLLKRGDYKLITGGTHALP